MANALRKLTDALAGTPSVPDAEERARTARQTTIDAGAALEQARAALAAADESGNPGEIQKAEAGLVAAERAADRATRGLEVAERRLEQAKGATAAAAREEGMRQLRQAAERHQKAATAAQQAVDSLGAAVAELDGADSAIGALQRQGVASRDAVPGHNYGAAATRRRIELALMRAGVVPGKPVHDTEPLSDWSAGLSRLLIADPVAEFSGRGVRGG
jgi:hypothetical protein